MTQMSSVWLVIAFNVVYNAAEIGAPSEMERRLVLAFSDIAVGQINKNKPIRLINRPIYGHGMLFRPQIDLNLTSQHHVPPGI